MTDEERQLIQGLADRIRNAPAPQIDRDADYLIRQSLGARPDALYILTQTVLIQEMALNQAKQQIEQLKAQPPQPAQPPESFLGNRPSGYQGSSYRSGYQAPQQPPPLPPQYVQPQYAQPQYAQPQYVVVDQPAPGGRFSSFLHSAAETAAGVVAGEVAFSALSSIFGHHGGGGFFGGGGAYSPGSETIINNYYEDGTRGGGNFTGGDRDLEAGGLSPDLEDRRFADDLSADDTTPDDDTTASDDTFDDGSSYYDDGSGSDDQ